VDDVPLARQISFRRTAHEAQKVAYNRSWDDLDIEATSSIGARTV
jgi:hypothetical protein